MRKSVRLSSIGLTTQAREPAKNFWTKFSLSSFTRRTRRVEGLTEEQRSAISQTGFGSLLSIPNQTLNRVFLTEVMEAWDPERRAFAVGSGEIPMSLLDVALILGLPVVGHPVVLTEEEPFSELEELYGAEPGKRKVALASLEERLDSIGKVVSDDFVRTFLLFTIGTFLSSNDKKVDSRYLNFLCDLESVSGFAWGAAVVEDMCQWLNKRKQQNVAGVGGCLIFLQTWSYEHIDIGWPILQDLTFPRVCRWDSKSYHKQAVAFKHLNDDQVIWKLQPTSEELQLQIIKEALELLDDSEELQRRENDLPSTSTNVCGVDSELQLSVSNVLHREDKVNFENQVVEDTPTRHNNDEVNTEQENDLENLRGETPPNLSICGSVHKEQEVNGEKLTVEEKLMILNAADRVGREEEFRADQHIVEDTSTSLSIDDEIEEEESHAEKLVVEDTPTSLSIADEIEGEELHAEKLIVEDTPTSLSIADEIEGEELHAEKLIVEDTPTSLSIVDEIEGEVLHAEKLIVEDTPTGLSIADEVSIEQEFNAENLTADDTPPKLSCCDDDLRKRNVFLEEENAVLKMKISQLMEKNAQVEEQKAELKKELYSMREENESLRPFRDFADRIGKHLYDFETDAY